MLPVVYSRIPPYFRPHEVNRIFKVASRRVLETSSPCRSFRAHRDFALIAVLYYTGVRISEAILLEWSSFNLNERVLTVKTLKKRRSRQPTREIPMPKDLVQIIHQYEIIAENHMLKFHSPVPTSFSLRRTHRGMRRNNPSPRRSPNSCNTSRPFAMSRTTAFRRVVSILLEAGIPKDNAHPHVFRHTYATRLSEAGVPPQTLAKLLGHSGLNHVMVYYHLNPIQVREAVEYAMTTNKEGA